MGRKGVCGRGLWSELELELVAVRSGGGYLFPETTYEKCSQLSPMP